ncbi:hypothetical protein J5282_21365 [Rhizobium sp. E27B/91]|nr:hypothetical protein [Rhizobium sp. E27B/91]
MVDMGSGNLRRPVGCIDHLANAKSICSIAAEYADELFCVLASNDVDWAACLLIELWLAEGVQILSCRIKLVLDKRHQFGVATLGTIAGSKRDDEVWYLPKPFHDLLGASTGPLAHDALRLSLFALTDDTFPLCVSSRRRRPDDRDPDCGRARLR